MRKYANLCAQVQRNHRLFFRSHLRELAAKYDRDPIGLLAAQAGGDSGAFQVRVEPAAALSPDDQQ